MHSSSGIIAELKAVDEIVHALDVTIHEPASPETKSCVMHGAEFLEDHLRRLYCLEESCGLLDIIVCVHPELDNEVHRLHAEHDAIRAEAHRLVLALENTAAPSDETLHGIMRAIRRLIGGILRHEHHEKAVLLDSINVDQGGEG